MATGFLLSSVDLAFVKFFSLVFVKVLLLLFFQEKKRSLRRSLKVLILIFNKGYNRERTGASVYKKQADGGTGGSAGAGVPCRFRRVLRLESFFHYGRARRKRRRDVQYILCRRRGAVRFGDGLRGGYRVLAYKKRYNAA
jgi:hypothetical protein